MTESHEIKIDYTTDPPTIHMGDLPPNAQIIAAVVTASAGVTHANGRVCDDDCESNGHYRDSDGNYYKEI